MRDESTTSAPAAANAAAIARPMPFEAPVTSAVFPVRDSSAIGALRLQSRVGWSIVGDRRPGTGPRRASRAGGGRRPQRRPGGARTRVGAGDGRGAAAGDRVELSLADLAGELGMERRVGAARAAAQTVVVQLAELGDRCRVRRGRRRGRAGRDGGGTGRAPPPGDGDSGRWRGTGRSARCGTSHSWTSKTRAAKRPPRRCRAAARSPSARRRTPPSRRASARPPGQACDTRRASAVPRPQARRGWCSAPQHGAPRRLGQCDADAGRAEHADHRSVDGPLPRVHDATGEEPDVGARADAAARSGAEGAAARPARARGAGVAGEREGPRPGDEQPMVRAR